MERRKDSWSAFCGLACSLRQHSNPGLCGVCGGVDGCVGGRVVGIIVAQLSWLGNFQGKRCPFPKSSPKITATMTSNRYCYSSITLNTILLSSI